MMRCSMAAAMGIAFALAGITFSGENDGFKPLFNGKDLTGWKAVLRDEAADPAKTFVVKDGEVQITGFPTGYLVTDRDFKNYVIRYTWRYPKEQPEKTTMNSGLLLHVSGPAKVWPISVEPQGRYKDHGKIYFPNHPKDAKTESTFDEAAHAKALKPAHEWNTTEATVRGDGSLEVRLNGVLIGTGKSELTSGPIGFQSEAARIHLKDVVIRELMPKFK